MIVSGDKIGLSSKEHIEIMNLKDIPENVQNRVDNKHWYTVCLNGRISDDELISLIQKSYELTK